ncbi:MAG: DHH family phosphoesterase [Lachnospiraceae bacterium]|nr:DHH family phosphoesterase [Lachnospiraceae bacterium]
MEKSLKMMRTVNAYMRWSLYLFFLMIAMDVCIYAAEPKVLYIGLIFTAVDLVILLALFFHKNRKIMKQLTEFGFQFNQVQRKMLLDLQVPYAMLDRDGFVLWANDKFRETTGMKFRTHCQIEEFFPWVTRQVLEGCGDEMEMTVDDNDRHRRYQLLLQSVALEEQEEGGAEGKGEIISLVVYDETEKNRLRVQNEERCLAIGLIYIDNYEEALEGINEVNGSLLPALVERKINQYMKNYDAVVKKTEKDKFLILFQKKYLTDMKKDKFGIVEEVRSLHIGNTVDITISIGIALCDNDDSGENKYSFLAAFEMAKEAINRALERGGDQVVVHGENKDRGGFSFYGGNSESAEKNNKVRSRVKTEAICDQIRTAENVLIMGHSRGDADSFGATIGMYKIARFYTDKVNIVLNEAMKTVAMILEQYKAGRSYEEGMFINGSEADRRINGGTLLIVVDVNNEDRTEWPSLVQKAGNIVVIDHHRETNPINARVTYSESYASSTCELITEMLQHLEETGKRQQAERILQINGDDADALYAGILLDTNSFITKTGVRTFGAAAYLKRRGADMTRVRKCFRKDKSSLYEKARIINSAETYKGIYSFAFNDFNFKDPDESPTEVGAQVANDLLDLEGVKASFVFTPCEGFIHVSARSMGEVNVEIIMNRCGGGGHYNMAGGQFKDCTLEEAIKRVKGVIAELQQGNKEM